jgi:preprotein translocase subunit SecY
MRRSAWRYLWTARDIRRKLLITLLILVIYRFAAHVPVPGVNREAIAAIMGGGGAGGTLVSLLDLFSGGTVSNFSVLADYSPVAGADNTSPPETDGRGSA